MFCSKKKGYFPFLAQKIQESLSVEDKSTFASFKTLEDRLKFVLSLPRLSSAYEDNLFKIIKPLRGEKSKEKSEENREAGNASFHSKNYRQAQILYSIAVFTAPPDCESRCFALALANRSACLQRLGSHRLAIEDIELALDSGYPEAKAFKLLERKAECLEHLGLFEEACESYEQAIDSLTSSSMPRDKKEKVKHSLTKKLHKVENPSSDDIISAKAREIAEIDIYSIPQPNPMYPAAHASVEIRYDPNYGRYAVATEEIPMGTPIINERPVTYCLYGEKFGLNCQHCFKVIRAVIPCPGCSWVCFCSRDCRDEALSTYHQYECPVMKLLLESGLNIYSFLGLRAVCKEGLSELLRLRSVIDGRDETSGTTSEQGDKVYDSDDIVNLFNLVAHEHLLDNEEWFLRTFIACFLLKLLMVTSFFNNSKAQAVKGIPQLTEDHLYIAKLFLQLLNIFPCNCHDVSEIESPVADQFAPTCNKVSLGAAVYPTLAMFNHSCNPDFMRCNRGNGVICIANRDIRKGEEINENYGLMYTMKRVKERQAVLRDHYKFECCCQACIEAWPTLTEMKTQLQLDPDDKLMQRFKRVRCIQCAANLSDQDHAGSIIKTCLICGFETDIVRDIPLKKIKELSRFSVQYLLTGQWSQGIDAGAECHDLIEKHLSFPMLEMTEIQIAIWKCMWLKFGNIKLVKLF